MNKAVIVAITGVDNAFAMKCEAGPVLLATGEGAWTAAVGETLSDFAYRLGRCTAIREGGQEVRIDIKSICDFKTPSRWDQSI